MSRSNVQFITSYAAFVRVASAVVLLIGISVLVGWMLDIAVLKSVWPGLATMKSNTALAFCLAGTSLWLKSAPNRTDNRQRGTIARVAALLIVLLGLLTLSEYALGWDLGIDQLLFRDSASVTNAPGRMAPITAFNFMLVGMALLLLDVRTQGGLYLAEWMFLGVIATSVVVIFGYIYEVQMLSQAKVATSLALHTTLTFILLCVAALCARHDQGIMRVLTNDSAAGVLARRLLLAVLIVPVVLGVLRLAGEKAGLYTDGLGDALAAVVASAVFAALIWWSARALDRSEMELRRVNCALKTLSDSNAVLMRAVSEFELLATICRMIVESGYRMVWVGYVVDDAAKMVRPVAQAGFEEGYLNTLQISWNDDEHGRGPTGTAIRTGKTVIANDILHDPAFLPWHAQAARRGYASSIALPLLDGGQMLGSLNIYSAEPDAFDAAETRLLTELANDLAYGITALRTREAHAQAAMQLRAQAARLNVLVDASRTFAEAGQEYQALLDLVSRQIAEALGDSCGIRLISDDQQWLELATLYDADPETLECARMVAAQTPLRVDEMAFIQGMLHGGQAFVVTGADQEQLRVSLKLESWSKLKHTAFDSRILAPMRLHGQTIGILFIARRSGSPGFEVQDLTLAQDLADRAALAISNACLFAQVRRSHAELEQRVVERTAELARANTDLRTEIAERMRLEQQVRQDAARSNALAELLQALAETNLEYQPLFETIARRISHLVGDCCVVTLLSEDGQWLQTVALYHPDPEGLAFARALTASESYRADEGLAGRVVQTGRAVLIPIVSQSQIRMQMKPEYRSYLDRFGMSSLLIVPLRARGRILGTLGVSRDCSGQPYTPDDQTFLQDLANRAGIALENARLFAEVQRARAAAEQANQAKTNFLRTTSHELRTPLNAIVGFTGMLLMQLPGPLTADQENQLQTIQNSARHLLALINDLLDLSRIEAGKVELNFERVVCQEIITEVTSSLRPLAKQKGLTLEVLAPEQEIAFRTDRRALSQILINLANNAIKFTAHGHVTITASQHPVNGSLRTEISVVDTGSGIRPEELPRLFKPFARADSPTVRASEGSGLGLHLSAQLANLLGGQITCESEYGLGSCFTFALEEP